MDRVLSALDSDELYETVEKALDTLAIEAAMHPNTCDWISVSIPKLRVGATPLVTLALDSIESDPIHRDMFNKFVKDAVTNKDFRESLKKSLRNPRTLVLVKALVAGQPLTKST